MELSFGTRSPIFGTNAEPLRLADENMIKEEICPASL
jgi:hypothetical protein